MQTSDIRLLRRLIRSFQRATTALVADDTCRGGLTLAQCHVLLELEEARECGPGVLAARLGLDKSTLSRTADGLVGMGLISRATDSSDRRYSLLSLTSAGRSKANIIHQVNDDAVRSMFGLIPRDRQTDIIASFSTLVDAAVEIGRERKARDGKLRGTSDKPKRRARS